MMPKILLFYLVSSILALSSLFASDKQYYELSRKGMDFAYNLEIKKAGEVFDEIIELDPENPHGYVLQAIISYYQLQLEGKSEVFEEKFKKFSAKAIKISKKNVSDTDRRLDALFYLGTMNMYQAAYHGGKNNWLRAYWYGKDGIKYLKKVIEIDSTYYDAYLGLGLYHYYADVMPKFIKTVSSILGIEGDRTKGLQELHLAAEKGNLSKAEALSFLGNIYLYAEKEYEKALACSKQLSNLYPKNVGFLVLHGENLKNTGSHDTAVNVFNKVLVDKISQTYPFYKIVSNYDLGNIYFELNDFEQALDHYLLALNLSLQANDSFAWATAWANYKIGLCHEILGSRESAVPFYEDVKKSDSKSAHKSAQERIKNAYLPVDFDLIKGKNLVKTENYDEAIELFEQTLTKIKDETEGYPGRKIPAAYHHLGKAHFEKGTYETAISKFKIILALENLQDKWVKPWTHHYLGKCYQELGEIAKAHSEYDIAYKFDDSALRFEIDKARGKK